MSVLFQTSQGDLDLSEDEDDEDDNDEFEEFPPDKELASFEVHFWSQTARQPVHVHSFGMFTSGTFPTQIVKLAVISSLSFGSHTCIIPQWSFLLHYFLLVII